MAADIVITKPAKKEVALKKAATKSVVVDPSTGGGGGGGTTNPFVTTKDNLVQFFCSTLKLLERIMIQTSAGLVRFTITFDEYGAYHLAFSENSPAAVAGVEIEDDSAAMYYDDYIFVNRLLTLPEGWTVSAVLFDNTENLLDVDNGWRLMDIQSTTHNLAQFFGVTLLEGYEFMTDTEVCGELEDIMQLVDPDLTAAQAAAITAQTLNPSES